MAKIDLSAEARRKAGFIDRKDGARILSRVCRLSLRYWPRLLVAFAASVGVAVFSLLAPKLLGLAVDQAQGLVRGHAMAAQHGLEVTAGLLIVVCAARGLSQATLGYAGEVLGQKVANDLRLIYFEKLQRQSFGFHDKIHSGDLITRGMIDLEAIRMFVENGMLRVIYIVLLVTFGAWMLLSSDWRMGLLAMAFFPIVIARSRHNGKVLRISWTQLQALQSVITRTMEENLQGIRVVRAFSAADYEMQKFDKTSDEALQLSYQRLRIRAGTTAINSTAFYSAMALVLWFGGRRVAAGQLTVGQLTEFLTYMGIFLMPLRQVAMITNSSARAISSGTRLFAILDAAPTIDDAPGAQPLRVAEGVVRFEHVGFAYEPGKPVLSDISFEVRPGKTLGIVGPPGSGKSTIANLIPRFYEAASGAITIDGQDIRDVTLQSLRSAVGLVQQDSFLFDGSVNNNVAYAEPYADEEMIVGAATTAQIHDHVASLPGGYATRVGERGVALSGGQRQRMSIARGVVPTTRILVFDDATAAIDALTEHRVRMALRPVTDRKATIIIAHRLSSLLHADEIIVLDAGRIVERGTHTELMESGGSYCELYRLQSRPAPTLQPEMQS